MLDEAGCLECVLLIGSWAEYLFEAVGVFDGYRCAIRTLDVDVLVRNKRRPPEVLSLTTVAKSHRFVVMQDRITNTTKLFHPGGLEIELLLGKVGAGLESLLETNIGVTAQTLRHLEAFACDPLSVSYEGMLVGIPNPETYVVQKIVVNFERSRKA